MTTRINGKTQLIGLVGWPVAHSLSPAMHNAAAADLGLELAYLPLAVHPDHLKEAIKGLAALGFRGVNVTVPHKESVMPLLDVVDPAAAVIGAVNTIVVSAGSVLTGYNFDWSGFMTDLKRLGVDVNGRQSILLGAGGSARAVTYGLATAGSQVHLYARREEQAQKVVAGLAGHCPDGSLFAHAWPALDAANEQFPETALIVNTTPIGMASQVEVSPWPKTATLPQQAFVYDLVYNPAETHLMRQARAAGLQAGNGLGMLLHQGAQAFKLWTGFEPDLEIMARSLIADP
jgi:shikimate dehydrogenase